MTVPDLAALYPDAPARSPCWRIGLQCCRITHADLDGFRLEKLEAIHAEAVEPVLRYHAQRGDAVAQTAFEVDAAGLGEVAYRDRDVAQAVAEPDGLDEELGIENEIVGIALEGNPLQHLTPRNAKTAVEI